MKEMTKGKKSMHCTVGHWIKHLRMIPIEVPPGEFSSVEASFIECAALSIKDEK